MVDLSAEAGSAVKADLFEAFFVVRIDRTDFSLSSFGAKMTRIGQLRDIWSSRLTFCQPQEIFLRSSFSKVTQSEKSGIECQCAWRRYHELDYSIEQQPPNCRCRQLEPNCDQTYMPANQAIKLLSRHRMQLGIRPRTLKCHAFLKF